MTTDEIQRNRREKIIRGLLLNKRGEIGKYS